MTAGRPPEQWAALKVPPGHIKKRMRQKDISVRRLAGLAGHSSHSHVYRLITGKCNTTSPHTADVIEAVLDADGLLFVRVSRTPSQVAAA